METLTVGGVTLRHELTADGHDAGPDAEPDTIRRPLVHHHGIAVSRSTVARHLVRAGLVAPAAEKRPKSTYVRFCADQPNGCWKSDFTHFRLTTTQEEPGADTEILTWLDGHSRKALRVAVHDRVAGPIVLMSFRNCAAEHGIPAPRKSAGSDRGQQIPVGLAGVEQ